MGLLKYEGCRNFRQRIVASTLSGKTLKIINIRNDDEAPGLHDFEANFLRLIEKISDGCQIEINETGTSLLYRPGLLMGGRITHDCALSRSIGWFIEGIITLIPFCKASLTAQFNGITNDSMDLSVDVLSNVTLPFLRNFGIEGASLKVKKRGAPPKGGGVVDFYCPIVREVKPIYVTDSGLIKKIRGVAFCSRISPTIISRVVDSARGVLNNLLPDVYIHTDHYKGLEGGNSPGYSLSLVAESTTGVLISSERSATADGGAAGDLPETVGQEAALMLLEEIRKGGVVDSSHQCLVLQLMVLGPEDVCKVRFGSELTNNAINTLQLLFDAFGVMFKIKADPIDNTILVSCLGIGFKNMARKVN